MALTITQNTGSVYAEYDNVKETFPVSTASSTALEGEVLTVDTIGGADVSRTAGTYTIGAADYTTDASGAGATFTVVVDGAGAATITVDTGGLGFVVNETFTIADADLGGGGAADLTFDVATISDNKVAVLGVEVTGLYSQFLTEAVKGDWIWLKDNDELRRIESVSDDGKVILETNATTDAATEYAIIKRQGFNSVGYAVDSIGAAEINSIPVFASMSETFRTDLRFIPILIDSTINANKVIVVAKNW